MMNAQPPDAGGPQEWSPELRQFVQDRQERKYRRLAEELKLGSDPAKAYAHLSRGPMPLDYALGQNLQQLRMDPFFSSKAYARLSGSPIDQELQEPRMEDFFTAEEQQEFKRGVTDIYKRYFSLKPPTPYEDPSRYTSMAISFDKVQEELIRQGHTPLQRLFLATLPSGDVNATTAIEPYTDDRIIFFEQGLFQFLTDFARLIGGITIPLSPQQLSSDRALAGLPRRYTMPPPSTEYFAGLLGEYVIDGTPLANPLPLPNPTHNMFTTGMLANGMQNFVMAHELAHVTLGHLDKKQAKELEYEADAFGLNVVSKSYQEAGGSWAVGFWACDLALTAFQFLYSTLGLLAFGTTELAWISQTHPDPLSRRARLREKVAQIIPDVTQVGLDAAGELCGMTDALLQKLWENANMMLLLSYSLKGARPSPMWNDWIKLNISTSN